MKVQVRAVWIEKTNLKIICTNGIYGAGYMTILPKIYQQSQYQMIMMFFKEIYGVMVEETPELIRKEVMFMEQNL